jgi:hypothetical protein
VFKKFQPDDTIDKDMIIRYVFFITKIAYVKMLFVIVCVYKFVVHQMDAKITFLND